MTQQDKDLLIRDLCARLPYGVKCSHPHGVAELESIAIEDYGIDVTFKTSDDNYYQIDSCKPYLRPMSSMTKEERSELSHYENPIQRTDFYYSHHLDCRYMIEKGLAIKVTEENNLYK